MRRSRQPLLRNIHTIFVIRLKQFAVGLTVLLLAATLAQAQTFTTLYSFRGGADGAYS
jgi:hypothetical protein